VCVVIMVSQALRHRFVPSHRQRVDTRRLAVFVQSICTPACAIVPATPPTYLTIWPPPITPPLHLYVLSARTVIWRVSWRPAVDRQVRPSALACGCGLGDRAPPRPP